MSTGLEARYSEHWLRACLQEHAQQLYCERQRGSAALAKPPSADGTPSTEMVLQYLEQLRSRSSQMTDKEMSHIFGGLLAFASDEGRLVELLHMLPGSSPLGCLSPIAAALYHPSPAVRDTACAVMRAVEAHKAARPCVASLNGFLQLGVPQAQTERAYA